MTERDEVIDTQLAAIDDALRTGTASATDEAERELQQLALALAADSPEPDPGFAANLGERVRTGFPRPPRFAWLPRLGMPQLAGLGVAASMLAAVALVATAGPRGEDQEGVDALSGGGRAEMEQPAPGASRGGFAPGRRERAIERSASLTLAAPADRLDRVADQIVSVTDRHEGFVLRSSVATGEEGTTGGNFELRIPERRLQAGLRDLSRLGTVRSRSQSGEDVTSRVVSAADRLQSARAERASLLQRLESADTDTEAEALRRQLDVNAREISGLRASLRDLRLRTNYATVSVNLDADDDSGSGSSSDQEGLSGALDDAVGTLSGSLELAVRALGMAIPLGLVAGLGWAAVRTARRRRREGALT